MIRQLQEIAGETLNQLKEREKEEKTLTLSQLVFEVEKNTKMLEHSEKRVRQLNEQMTRAQQDTFAFKEALGEMFDAHIQLKQQIYARARELGKLQKSADPIDKMLVQAIELLIKGKTYKLNKLERAKTSLPEGYERALSSYLQTQGTLDEANQDYLLARAALVRTLDKAHAQLEPAPQALSENEPKDEDENENVRISAFPVLAAYPEAVEPQETGSVLQPDETNALQLSVPHFEAKTTGFFDYIFKSERALISDEEEMLNYVYWTSKNKKEIETESEISEVQSVVTSETPEAPKEEAESAPAFAFSEWSESETPFLASSESAHEIAFSESSETLVLEESEAQRRSEENQTPQGIYANVLTKKAIRGARNRRQ
ncbi:MAG: hypothetical protein LBI11_02645 [Streptococcaceae bacterium]|jgi:hypothetical protein|nr:hypothetical protein [Streptococcaceae bacterium]